MPLDDATQQSPTPMKYPKKDSKGKVKKFKSDEVLVNPKLEDIIQEEKSKSVAVLFGRMNPPTKGHEENVEGLKKLAKQHNADHVVIASHSQDAKKNPLTSAQKTKHLKRAFPGTTVTTSSKEKPSIYHHLSDLHSQGYEHVHIAGGEDRASEYENVKKYNGKESKHGFYNFKSITVHNTGERKKGVSGTDMRKHAQSGDFESFRKNLPSKLAANEKHAKAVFDDTRKGMHLAESLELFERVVTLQQRRKRAQSMRRYSSRLARARKISRMRLAQNTQISRRSSKIAKSALRARFAGARGVKYQTLAPSDKVSVDRQIDAKTKLIKRMVQRIQPRVKQADVRRLQAVRSHKKYRSNVMPRGTIMNSVEYNDLFSQMFTEHLQVEQFNKIYDLVMNENFITESEEKSLIKKSDKSGVPLTVIQEVYHRGVEEWSDSVQKTPQQLGFERVNSFIAQGETFYTKDKDLNESFGSFFTAKDLGMKAQGGFEYHPSVMMEDAASHMRSAAQLDKEGKSALAGMHRKIANALTKGDRTTASSLYDELHKKKTQLMGEEAMNLSFAVPASFVEMLKRAQKQISNRDKDQDKK